MYDSSVDILSIQYEMRFNRRGPTFVWRTIKNTASGAVFSYNMCT
jgi:hypothetical protein